MPATGKLAPASRERGLRLAITTLALVFICSAVTLTPTPVAAASELSRQISAMRYSQLAYEGAMRAADREIQSLKRAAKQVKRSRKKTTAKLDRALARRRAAKH